MSSLGNGRWPVISRTPLFDILDLAWAQRGGHTSIVALDWQRAFDAIDPTALLGALKRFGLPQHVLDVVRAIYADRKFQVRDCGQVSDVRPQHSGISQGCPLSPFLFVMLMTVLMQDAVENLQAVDKELLRNGNLAELLYADDTLLLSVSPASLERLISAVSDAGAKYGSNSTWASYSSLR